MASKQKAWQKIRGIVRRAEPALQRSVVRAIVATREGAHVAAIRKAYASGRIEDAVNAVAWEEFGEPILRQEFARSLLDVYEASGNAASVELPYTNEFTILNERPTNWMRDNSAQLVREVSEQTKAGLRATLTSAYEAGWSAQRVAQVVKTQVGLTEHQQSFVWNMRDRLEGKGWSQSSIDDEAAAYTRQLTQMRALMIARTEAQRAASSGQQEAWMQAADDEYFDKDKALREWIMVERDHPDDDPCVRLNGTKAGMEEEFEPGIFAPPDPHPNCVCGLSIILGD